MEQIFAILILSLIGLVAGDTSIINGEDAYYGQFPFIARLDTWNNGEWAFTCGGSLIHNGRHVLTAKHCVQSVASSNIRVFLGDHQRLNVDPGEQVYAVSEVHLYNKGDIAVLKLSTDADTSGEFIDTIGLASSLPWAGEYVTLAGWGWTENTESSPANILQTVEVPMALSTRCNYQLPRPLNDNEFCFGDPALPYTNACHGDSGGPVATFMEGKMRLLGVISRKADVNLGCHTNSDYAVAVSVADDEVAKFIKCKTGQKRCGCFPGDSSVQHKTNGMVSMHEINVGDQVLAMNSNNELVYSEVIMFLHREPSTTSEYYVIQTGEASLHVSARHLVRVAGNGTLDTMYKYAKDVSANDLILVVTSNGWKEFPVLDVSVVHERGVYAPLTTEGTIIVNGVVTSCYASFWSHDLAHLAFLPVRFLYKYDFFGWASFMFQPNNNGIAWYPQFLMDNVEPFVFSYFFAN